MLRSESSRPDIFSACKAGPISFLANGLFAQLAQVLLLRELLVVLDGHELAIGVMLACWLIGVGGGAAVAGGRGAEPAPARWYAVAVTLAAISLPIAMMAIRLARPLFDTPLGTPLAIHHTVLLTCLGAALPSFAIGALFPLMIRVTGARPATVYGIEAAGAMLGGVLFVFVLVDHVAPLAIAAVGGLICIASAIWLIRSVAPVGARRVVWPAACAFALVLCVIFGPWLDRGAEQLRWRNLLPGHRFIETRESPYGRYTLLESNEQFSLFLDGSWLGDWPDPHAGAFLAHTTMLQHASARSVLIVSSTGDALVRETLRHNPARIDLITLDPVPLAILEEHLTSPALAALGDPIVHRLYADASEHLAASKSIYDVILIDMADPTTLGLNRFYTRGFIEAAAASLRPGGVLALTISSQANYLGPALRRRNATVYHTVRHVLPQTLATPGDTCLILARKEAENGRSDSHPLTLDVDELASRYTLRGIDAQAYEAFLYTDPFPAHRIMAVNRSLATFPAPEAPLAVEDVLGGAAATWTPPNLRTDGPTNSALLPVAHWHTSMVELEKHEPHLVLAFERISTTLRWALPAAPIALALALGLVRLQQIGFSRGGLRLVERPANPVNSRGHQQAGFARPAARNTETGSALARAGLVVSAGAAGFCVMTLQVLILLWYQSCVGQVYIGLALLVAAMMAGIGVGSMPKVCRRRAGLAMISAQVLLVTLALLIPHGLSLDAVTVRWMAPAASGIVGALLGLHFAACNAAWARPTDEPAHRAARWLYVGDLLGAALAAPVIAALFIPVFGYQAAASVAALFGVLAVTATIVARSASEETHETEHTR